MDVWLPDRLLLSLSRALSLSLWCVTFVVYPIASLRSLSVSRLTVCPVVCVSQSVFARSLDFESIHLEPCRVSFRVKLTRPFFQTTEKHAIVVTNYTPFANHLSFFFAPNEFKSIVSLPSVWLVMIRAFVVMVVR